MAVIYLHIKYFANHTWLAFLCKIMRPDSYREHTIITEERYLSKVAIITDSNSGITQKQANMTEGLFVLPMPFMINGQEYFEDITLSQKEFYEKLKMDADISTSQPSIESVITMWEQALESYDEVIYMPMSSGLSSSCETAMMLAQDYEDKVHVVNNQRISVTLRQAVLESVRMAQSGCNASEIKEYMERTKFESTIYIMVDTLKYLKKGGRVTPAAAALGTLLRIKPVLQIQGERLDAFAKARTVNQAKSIMIDAIQRDIDTRFGGEIDKLQIDMAHTDNPKAIEIFRQEAATAFPGHDIYVDCLSLSVSCHIGPGALAITCTRKLEL